MPIVQNFDRSMIETHLRRRALQFLTDSDGDFVAQFRYDEEIGGELTVQYMAEGSQNEIYTLRVRSSRTIPKNSWGRAIMSCNTWNKERRWPKAYLYVRDSMTDSSGEIILEEQIDLEKGVHQELLDDFTETVEGTAFAFWKWAYKEQGL